MSADNWTTCPRCKANRRRDAHAAQDAVERAYGQVDLAEFDRLRFKANELAGKAEANSTEFMTFREDYEIFGAEDGEVVIGYSGGCFKCGLSLNVEHRHSLAVNEVDQ